MSEYERCKGCIMGAWLGDATGAILEFSGRPSESSLSLALTLPGGGHHKVGPGQITDDGELTCCLLKGLVAGNGSLDLNKIASIYGLWINSRPFDLGGTLRKSLPKAVNMKIHQAEMVRRGAKLSATSQSNGCLMRISPLAVWCRNLSPEDAFIAADEEVQLSHPNETIRLACCFYVIAIGVLIRTGDRHAAFMAAKEFCVRKSNSEFLGWIEMVEDDGRELFIHKPAGWGKIAFVYGFRYLLRGMSYMEAICEIMRGGGDTDTNACIIGALIASADGLNSLPQANLQIIRSWAPSRGGINRPKWLRVSENEPLIDQLINLSPSHLTTIGDSASYIKK